MLRFMGSQRVGHGGATELNRINNIIKISCITKEAYAFIVNQLKISEAVSCKNIDREI